MVMISVLPIVVCFDGGSLTHSTRMTLALALSPPFSQVVVFIR